MSRKLCGRYDSESSYIKDSSLFFPVLFSDSAIGKPRMSPANISAVISAGISSSVKAASSEEQ